MATIQRVHHPSEETLLRCAEALEELLYDDDPGEDIYAPINSPSFTGVPMAPTAAIGTDTTQIATCAFVVAEINKTIIEIENGTY